MPNREQKNPVRTRRDGSIDTAYYLTEGHVVGTSQSRTQAKIFLTRQPETHQFTWLKDVMPFRAIFAHRTILTD